MTTPVQERLKAEFETAKEESKQRVERISDILKAAATMTFEEIKEGSAEIHILTRKSVAELLEDLKESSEVVNGDVIEPQDTVNNDAVDAQTAPPTWREIIMNALEVFRDRKGDWFGQFKAYLNEYYAKFDAEMTDEYGDRYRQTKSVFQKLVIWVQGSVGQSKPSTQNDEVKPVTIEVMDDAEVAAEAEQSNL